MEDWTNFSGEENYRRPPSLTLDQIRLAGDLGHFNKVFKDGEKYEKIALTTTGAPLTGIFLRVRRRLVDFKGEMTSSEHNTPNDEIVLFGPNGMRVNGKAAELRDKYKNLKTEQVVYFLYDEKVYRLIVRGASLGSESKPPKSVPFYAYLNTFQGKDHVWQFETVMTPMQETNKAKKSYYAISFERGMALEAPYIDSTVGPHMRDLHEVFEAQKSFYEAKDTDVKKSEIIPDDEEMPIIHVDEEDEGGPEVPF